MKILHKKTPLQCTQEKFQEGQFKLIREHTINWQTFLKYQYVMPSFLFECVDNIAKYFKILDTLTTSNTDHKIRVTHDDLFDTSINSLYQLRTSLNCRNSFILGSQYISPIVWATIGNQNCDLLSKHQFGNFYDVIRYYETKIIHHKNYATMNVLTKKGSFNGLKILADVCGTSENVALTISIMFLFDLLKNSGPDSNHFLELYTNNSRGLNNDLVLNWQKAYKSTISSTNYYYPSTSKVRHNKIKDNNRYVKNNPIYSEVEIIDVCFNLYDV